MNRDAPDGNSFSLVRLDELRVVVGPGLIELRFQFSTVEHVIVGLHERRWTPRAAKESERSASGGHRLLDEGNAELPVVVDAEGLQLLVAFVDVGVASGREIAAVNVGSSNRVTDAFVRIKVGVQNFPLFGRRQFRKNLSGRIGECAADAQDRLSSL